MNPRRLTVVVTGGESLCHLGLFDIGHDITNLGSPWGMVSNGWGWTESRVGQELTVRDQPFRRRQWMRTGLCSECTDWSHCQGGPMHLRRDGHEGPMLCHLKDFQL